MSTLSHPALRAAFLLVSAATLAAQIPEHHALVGTISIPGLRAAQRGTTGLFVPLRPGAGTV